MATLAQLEEGVRKAYEAGNMEYARLLGAELVRARKDPVNQIPDTQIPSTSAPTPEPGLGQQALGALETGATLVTGATGGTLGTIGGTLKGLAEQLLSGEFGTPQAMQAVQKAAVEGGQALTYAPRTQAGQDMTQAVAQTLGDVLPPVIPMIGQAGQIGQGARAATTAATTTARAGVAAGREAVQQAGARVAQVVGRPEAPQTPTPGTMGSVGAAGVDIATLRRMDAQNLPIPIDLTKGQATRQFEQVRFEQEMAKDPNKGQPLRERFADQNQAVLRNFDAFVDETGAQLVDPVSVGDAVQSALRSSAAADKNRIRVAYKKAEQAGAMEDPVNMDPLVAYLNEAAPDAATAPLLNTARSWAIKYGIAREEGGVLVPVRGSDGSSLMNTRASGVTTLATAEKYRQMINRNTDFEPTNVRQATIIKGLIDQSTEGAGGEAYRQARMLRRQYAEKYENFGLASDLINNKRGMTDAKVAAEDVFRKAILNSSVADVRQLGRLMKTSGDQGRKAWAEVQGAAVRHIQDQATKNVSRDSRGNAIVSPKGLDDAIKAMDRAGKLDYLFGKKGAEQLRAINDLAKVVYTAPPGTINTSNTASVILAALDMATSGVAGMPLPVMSGIRILTTHVKDQRIQKRIQEALGVLPEKKAPRKAAPPPIPPSPGTTRAPESRVVQ